MAEAERLVLFIDWQNSYRGAREVFGLQNRFHALGQVDPLLLGERIASRNVAGRTRALQEVRVYSGRPDPRIDARTYAAHMRQCAAWEKTGRVIVRTRQLRYPRDWPKASAEEKGIDVQLAIDFVMGSLRGDFDVGVIFSTDTDLLPALEGSVELKRRGEAVRMPEVAAWREVGGRGRRRLNISGTPLHCHWLEWADLKAVEDRTDYNISASGP